MMRRLQLRWLATAAGATKAPKAPFAPGASRLRRALDVKPDSAADPANVDPQVARLHRELTARHKWAVRNHTKPAEALAAAAVDTSETETATSFAEARRLHVDRLVIHRAGDHIEVDMALTGIVQLTDKLGGEERAYKKRVMPEVGYSTIVPGGTRDFESDGFLDTLKRSMTAQLPRLPSATGLPRVAAGAFGQRGGRQGGAPQRFNRGGNN
jgi:hypothetical protein